MGGDLAQERLWFLKAREGVLDLGVYGFVYVQKQPLKEYPRVVQEKAVKNPAVQTTMRAIKSLEPHCEAPCPSLLLGEPMTSQSFPSMSTAWGSVVKKNRFPTESGTWVSQSLLICPLSHLLTALSSLAKTNKKQNEIEPKGEFHVWPVFPLYL